MNSINGACASEQMQMRKMDGSGGGQGKGSGMKDIMQNLSTENRTLIKEQLGTMTMDERMAMVSQMKEVDKTSMNDEDYIQNLLDILNVKNTNDAQTEGFNVYT